MPHRLELVAEIGGVRFVNDSKATNTAAARRALASYDVPLHVILGGSRKGESFDELARELHGRAYLIGETAEELAEALDRAGVPYVRCGDLESAVSAAAATARSGRGRPALAGVRELRPVPRLRAAGRGIQEAGAEPIRVKRGHLESNVLVLVTLALVAFGMVMVYSATSASATIGGGNPAYYLKRQAIFAFLGLGLLVAARLWSYRSLRHTAPVLVLGSLLLLLVALVGGQNVNGARRWIDLGAASFQPSEIAKLAVVVWIALYLSKRPVPTTLGELTKPIGLMVAAFCALVLAEPDLGTVIAICLVVGAMLLVAGAPVRLLGVSAAIVSVATVVAIWFEPYRRTRFFSFVDPWRDAQGAGYQTVQAMIGIGSGGIFGKGLGESVGKVFYLPEAHTDMIFAVIGEELGLVGATLLIAAYAALGWAGLRIALRCHDPFGKGLAVGITTLICGQAALNLAAVVGAAPLTGVPLPLVSYGGTSLVVMLASVGILLNIARDDGVEAAAQVRDRGRRDRRSRDPVARRRAGAPRPRRERELRRLA